MTFALTRWAIIPLACVLIAGCASTPSLRTSRIPSGLRLSYSPLTEPPLAAKGRMLIRPFSDHHPGGPQSIPGISGSVQIASDQSLARTVSEAFAEASRFAGYEVLVAAEPTAAFQPDVVVEGDIQACQMGTDNFAGMMVTTHRLKLQVRLARPGNALPVWQGSIHGTAGNFLSHNTAARKSTYELMLRDSINSAMQEWVQTLDPAADRAAIPSRMNLATGGVKSAPR